MKIAKDSLNIAVRKKRLNSYYVVNKDEPYAEAVHGVIMGGEAVKAHKEALDHLTECFNFANGNMRLCMVRRCIQFPEGATTAGGIYGEWKNV